MVMVMTAVSIVISVIVLDLHHHEPTHPVPRWLRYFVFGTMARIMCMYTPYSSEIRVPASMQPRFHSSRRRSSSHYSNSRQQSQRKPRCDEEDCLNVEQNGVEGINVQVRYMYDELDSIVTSQNKKRPVLEEILQHLRDITSKMKKNTRRDQIKEEWKMLAKVIDRFLLVIFLLAITTLSLSILYIYPRLHTPEVIVE